MKVTNEGNDVIMKNSIHGNPLISIIVPVYNVELYLGQCLDSLVNQTYENLEIICVNDGSADGSSQILNQFKEKDSRIRVIDQCNKGVSKARNAALEVSTGEFVMFVDGDDWIDVNTCENVVAIQQETQADIVMWSYVSEHRNSAVYKNIFPEDKIIFEESEVREKLHRRFVGLVGEELKYPEKADSLSPVWGKLYNRELIMNHDIEFVDIREIGSCEDGLFNLEVFYYAKRAVYIRKYHNHYRRTNTQSETSQYKERLADQWERLYQRMSDYICQNELPSIYKTALENRISLGILGLGLNLTGSEKSFWQKRHEIKKLLSRESYKNAVKQLTLRYFPIHWKVFFACAKINFATGILGLLLIIQEIIQ